MNQRKRLIINVLSNYGAYAIFAVVGFVLVGYLVRKLGGEAFGVISLLLSVTVITEFLGVGISHAITKHVSASLGKDEHEFVNQLVSTSLVWYTVCGIIGAFLCVMLSFYVDQLFEIPEQLILQARWGMRLMALRVLICFPFNTFLGLLWAHQRYDLTNLARSVTIILRLAGIVVCFEFFSASITSFILITFLSLLIERILWVIFSRRLDCYLKIGPSHISFNSFAVLISFGSFILIIQIANMIGYEAVKWVIGLEMTLVDVGAYTLIASLAVIAGELIRSVAKVLVPVSSRYNALNLHDKNAQLLLLGTKYAMIVASCLCLLPLLLLKPFLYFWVGDEYDLSYMSELALAGGVLLIGQWFISMGICLLQMLSGVGKVRVPAIITMLWAVGGLLAVWVNIHWFQKTLFAVVLIVSIARLIGTLAHMFYGIRALRVPVGNLAGSIFRPSCAGFAVLILSYFFVEHLDVYKIKNFIAVGFVLVSLFCLLVWISVLSKSERENLKTFVTAFIFKSNRV